MHLLIDILRNSILITGLVIVMMMMIESLNIESKGLIFKGLRKTKIGQVVIAALLGSIPGCMGGFATVSLYTHRMFSFGALVAMMIASSGDEAFVMLAMIPQQALVLFAILFVLAIVVGVLTDVLGKRFNFGLKAECEEGYTVHEGHEHCHSEPSHCLSEPSHCHSERAKRVEEPPRHFGWKRILMLAGLAVFIFALASGQLGHDHGAHTDSAASGMTEEHSHCCEHEHAVCEHGHTHYHCEPVERHCEDDTIERHYEDGAIERHCEDGTIERHCEERSDVAISTINLLDEQWMNILFAGLSVLVLVVLIFASDHFVEEHLWKHIVKKHLPVIFAWTFGVLLVLGIALQYVDINHWISSNTALMILLATLIGIIPESGPHMIFVTLFATGVVPFPVLLASSISQDGHASIPLLAESRKSFLWAKIINCAVALAAGYAAMLI